MASGLSMLAPKRIDADEAGAERDEEPRFAPRRDVR